MQVTNLMKLSHATTNHMMTITNTKWELDRLSLFSQTGVNLIAKLSSKWLA